MNSKLFQAPCFILLLIVLGCGPQGTPGQNPSTTAADQPSVDSGSPPWEEDFEENSNPHLDPHQDPGLAASESVPTPPDSDSNLKPSENSSPALPERPQPPVRYTKYCRLDEEGKVITPDVIHVQATSTTFSGLGGGCIQRPIRQVWATFLDHESMKDTEVHEYIPTFRRDLVTPLDTPKNPITYFVFDIESVYWAILGLYPVKWKNQFFHTILVGQFLDPKKILIKGDKISGEGRIKLIQEEFQLEWISPTVTSLILSQNIEAPRVSSQKVEHTLRRILSNARRTQSDLRILNSDPR